MKKRTLCHRDQGFTLVELMITIAVLSVITAIAIPAYNGYVREGHFATMRSEINGLRTSFEDFRLDNTTYVGAAADPAIATFLTEINSGSYVYAVSASTGSFDVSGTFSPTVWVRCEDRLNRCCDSDTGGGATVSNCNFP